MKGNKYIFFVALGAMVLFALAAIAGIIIYFAKAAAFPVYISLIAAGVGGVIVSIALTMLFIPKNSDGDPENDNGGK